VKPIKSISLIPNAERIGGSRIVRAGIEDITVIAGAMSSTLAGMNDKTITLGMLDNPKSTPLKAAITPIPKIAFERSIAPIKVFVACHAKNLPRLI